MAHMRESLSRTKAGSRAPTRVKSSEVGVHRTGKRRDHPDVASLCRAAQCVGLDHPQFLANLSEGVQTSIEVLLAVGG